MTASGTWGRFLGVVLGRGARAAHPEGVAIGHLARVDAPTPGVTASGVAIGSGAVVAAPAASGTAIGRGASSAGGVAVGQNARSTGVDSVAIGLNATAAAGCIAIHAGNQFAGATAQGIETAAIGRIATANGNRSLALGWGATATGTSYSTALQGTATGNRSVALGPDLTASGSCSTALGWLGSAVNAGQIAMCQGTFATLGDAVRSHYLPKAITTDATQTQLVMQIDASTARILIGTGRIYTFNIKASARRTDVVGTSAGWPLITGVITRDASGAPRLLGTVTGGGTTTLCDAGASTWTVDVSADTTNNALAVTVTGEAGKTIRWLAAVDLVEIG